MAKTALLIGGTGPTGPFLVQGLLDRGYDVTIFHRGVHESDDLPEVPHIHGDPHFKETIEESLKGLSFDLVMAVYGRVRLQAEVLAGRCQQFIAVGGAPALRGQLAPENVKPYGMKGVLRETDPTVTDEAENRGAYMIALTEQVIMDLQKKGAFNATVFRYPQIYGPRTINPREWSVVKRVIDGRPYIITPESGLQLRSRMAARNAAHCVLLAVDKPEQASGQIYHPADDEQYFIRQWQEMTAEVTRELTNGGPLAMQSLPEEIGAPFHSIPRPLNHMYLDTTKVKQQLGYQDVISPQDALRETVEWLLKVRPTPESYPNFPDRFEYEMEDRVVAAYKQAAEEIRKLAPLEVRRVHSYAHPTKPGEKDRFGR